EPETIVKFKGNIASITGSSNDDEDSKDYVWGLYPYSPSASYSEPDGISRTARMTLTYTDMQTGVAGSFGDNLAVMIGRSESLAIPFRGAYSGAFFKVNRDDIVSMTLEGLNGEVLAGTATIGLDNSQLPVVYDVADPKTAVTVTAPNGTFEPGANYYIITLPDVPLPNGYKVTLRRADGYQGTYELRANRPLNRIKFRNLSDPIDVRIESAANIEAGTSTGWVQSTTQGINEIWYTTSDGQPVTYTVDGSTGNEVDEIIAPADNGGTGIIRFKAPITGIDQEAFSGMTTLTSVSLPRTVVSIGAFAFCDCYDMDNVGFGTSLETIGEYAFFNCGFQNLSLPEGITELGSFSFGSNRNLETAYLPSSLESPGSAVFWSCPNLREFNGAFSSDDNRCLIDASDPENMTLRAFATGGLGSDDSYTVPNMIRTIGAYAFSNVSVGSILLPRSLTTIEGSAFFGCHSLKSITIPPGVNKVSGQAFYACDNLEMIEIQNEDDVITADGAGPLHQTGNCPIVVPAKFLNYYKNYRYWDEYKDRYIPSMSDNEIIYMTSDGEAVGYNTEASTGNQVSEIIAPNDNGGVGIIRFIDPLTTIDDMALSAMHNLTEVFLPDCVESIGDSAFEYSEILSSVHLGSGLKLIGTWAFGSTSLTTIDLPEGLEVIGTCAFENCPLTSVTIPESVMYLGSSDGRTIPMGNPFSGCTRLESFSGKFATDDGKALIETIQGNRYFISCVAGNYGETYYVPDVEEISFWAFNSSGMSEIVLPQSLSVIRDGAFMHCSNLVSLMVPPSVEVVGGAAFYGCGSLEWVK
ncbi:MAG: leucine-rich repeat protein, partial [Bacteroidales bacterium]|nr:leucine-rich repeat protein [Bacteroidales bacterium]